MTHQPLHRGAGTLALALTTIILAAASARGQVTIYADDFSGSGGALNGAAVDVGGQNWIAGSVFHDNGIVDTLVAASANGQAAFLPFTPVSGNIYLATATINNPNPNWIAFGFMPTLPSGGDWTATDFSVRHSNNGAFGWVLNRSNPTAADQQGFNGAGTANQAFGSGTADIIANQPVTVAIQLDTTAATWTAQYFLNGVQQGGTFNLAAGANTGIGGIGFSRDRNATANSGGSVSAFSLVQVPEPSTLTLLGVGALGLLCRRRK